MITSDEQLQEITESALRRAFLLFAIFAIPTVLVSVLRGVKGEWEPVFTLHVGVLVVIWAITALSSSIPRMILGGLMIGICVAVGWGGLYTYGVLAPASHWIMAIAMFINGMLCGLRGMVVTTFILLAGMLLIAGLHLNGAVIPVVSAAEFLAAPASWLVELMCALLFMAIVLPTSRNFVVALQTLMSEVELRRDKIAHLAEHDELTGLPKLRVARDRLSVACHRNRRSGGLPAVMFIDLDGFKTVNDSYGHEAGDSCLRAVSTRLAGRLRREDTAARIGGDEFVVVLEAVADEDAAAHLASELISLIKQPIEFEGHTLQVGASIGVALYPENGKNVQSLLQNADQAMYRSKRAGSNGFAFAGIDTSIVSEGEHDEVELDDDVPAAVKPAAAVQHSLVNQWLDAIVDRTIVVIAAVLTLTLVANIWRIVQNQAAPNLGATVAAFVLVVALFFLRGQVPLWTKMALASSVGLLIALPGLYFSGLAGPGIGWALAAALFLIGIFYNWRICLGIAVIVSVAILLAGAGFVSDTLGHRFDVTQGALHPATWLVFLLASMAYNGIVLSAWYLHKKTSMRLVDETRAQIAELVRLATFDELTGLPSLRLANDRLKMACSRAQRADARAAVMLVDLDGFKEVNDSLGHDAGDHCLREIASRMTSQVRSADTVARIGGDEFLVLLDIVTELEGVSATADRLLAAIVSPIEYGNDQFAVSASIGIAIFPDHGREGDSLRQSADAAMYAAKLSGKNRIEFAAPGPPNSCPPLINQH